GLLGGAAAQPLAPWAQQSVMPTTLTAQEAQNIALEAYIYFYPLVIMDVTRKHFTNIEADKKFGRGPMNTFTRARTFPPAMFRGATHPNFDTLYSLSCLDLTKGPVVISVPDTHGRYYLLQMLDMWMDTFAGVGKRTTGTDAGNFVVVGPRWQGELPQGLQRISAPTPFSWVIGRTRTDGAQGVDRRMAEGWAQGQRLGHEHGFRRLRCELSETRNRCQVRDRHEFARRLNLSRHGGQPTRWKEQVRHALREGCASARRRILGR